MGGAQAALVDAVAPHFGPRLKGYSVVGIESAVSELGSACPSRKSYPRVAMMQSGKDWRSWKIDFSNAYFSSGSWNGSFACLMTAKDICAHFVSFVLASFATSK